MQGGARICPVAGARYDEAEIKTHSAETAIVSASAKLKVDKTEAT
jgi:hypothetical protein